MRVFAFDMGTGSIGECVREEREIKYLDVHLLPSDFASINEAANRRRIYRTRLTHKAREDWWRRCAIDAGIEVLETRQPTKTNPKLKADQRMLREFSAEGDDIIYTSCLLRIALLQGRKLEGWQVFKAVWSAIQHRGYDSALPWKKNISRNIAGSDDVLSEKENVQVEDEKKNQEAAQEYERYLREHIKDEKYFFPCYYEAYRMGLWKPEDPSRLVTRHTTPSPEPARNKGEEDALIAPRRRVINELESLLENASKLFPKLQGKEKQIIYGTGKEQYATYKSAFFGPNRPWFRSNSATITEHSGHRHGPNRPPFRSIPATLA